MEEKIVCPICQSEENRFYCEKSEYRLYYCLACGLVFVFPIPSDLDGIYTEEYFKGKNEKNDFGYADYDKDKESMKDQFLSHLEEIEHLVSRKNIFDVGAATGYFLNLARNRGWHTAGIEISEYAANLAKSKGHKVSCGQLPQVKIEDKFDVVTMWDVLEHLDNPEKYLKIINRILVSDNGWLIINTINRESLWAKLLGSRWQLIVPPEHLFYYSKKSLELLLEQTGFEIERIKSVGKKFSLSYIFKILYRWQNLKIFAKLSLYFNKPFWRKFVIPINLRDNIFIIAKKIKDV